MRRDPVFRFRGHQRPTEDSRTPILAARNDLPSTSVDGSVATMRLYDPIDDWGEFWGTSSGEFAAALEQLPDTVTTIHLHINSPGGVITEGIAITSQLRQWSATVPERRVVAYVDGLAASIASLIAVAVDETVMNPDSMMMIHDGSGVCFGTAADMHAAGDGLDLMSNTIAGAYARKAGGTAEEWRAVMIARGVYGQWYSAQEAVAAGLADRISDEPAIDEPVDQATARAAAHRAALTAASTVSDADAIAEATQQERQAQRDAELAAAAAAARDADHHRHLGHLAGVHPAGA